MSKNLLAGLDKTNINELIDRMYDHKEIPGDLLAIAILRIAHELEKPNSLKLEKLILAYETRWRN